MGDTGQVKIIKLQADGQNEYDNDFIWDHEKVKLLLECYMERKEQFKSKIVKKKTLWQEIKSIFQTHGYYISVENLDSKFRNLKRTFKNVYEKSGTEKVRWLYFQDFLKLYEGEEIETSNHSYIDKECNSFKNEREHAESPQHIDLLALVDETCTNPANTVSQVFIEEEESYSAASRRSNKYKTGRLSGDRFNDFKRQQLMLDRQRVKELRELRRAVEDSNRIQEERNQIMRLYVEMMND